MSKYMNLGIPFSRHELLQSIKTSLHLTAHNVIGGLAGLWLAYSISTIIYNIWFHPLAKYPGPKFAAASGLVYIYNYEKGNAVHWIDKLHRQYGEVVRLGPDRLSYIIPECWKDIYGHHTATHKANAKDVKFFVKPFPNGYHSIVTAPTGPEHSRQRKIFSNAFSDRALNQQEPMLLEYAHQMVDVVHRKSAANATDKTVVLDAVKLFNSATFDIMADLTFGESLGNLKNGPSPWIDNVMANFKKLMQMQMLIQNPILFYGFIFTMPKEKKEDADAHVKNSHERVSRRLEKGVGARPDIWGLVLKAQDQDKGLTRQEMDNNADTL